jgi:hypothetical protein
MANHPESFRPYLAIYNGDLKTSTILDRAYRPILTLRGRFPLVDWNSAVECPDDAPPVTAGREAIRIYFENANRKEIDMRLRPLFARCGVLRSVVNRRINAVSVPPPRVAQLDLIAATFR